MLEEGRLDEREEGEERLVLREETGEGRLVEREGEGKVGVEE